MKYCEKLLRTVILYIENIFYYCFGESVLNKQLWWYVFVICKVELIPCLHLVTSSFCLLNKRYELVTKCRYENKFYLANYKDIPP